MDLEKHPLNRTFDWDPPKGPYRRITDSQAQDWNEKGFFVLKDAFDAQTLQKVLAELDPKEEVVETNLQKAPGGQLFIARAGALTFTVHPVISSEVLQGFAGHEVFRDLAHDLIGPDVRLYWDQAVYKKTQIQQEFPWHQDNGYAYVEPQQYLTCWVALTDATVENGCPWVVPGIHKKGTLKHWHTESGWQCFKKPEGAVAVPAVAGSIVVFSSLTPHRTGPNLTDEVRKAYILQYAPEGAQKLKVRAGADYDFWASAQRKFDNLHNAPEGAKEMNGKSQVEEAVFVLQQDPRTQFFILRGGEACALPAVP